MVLGAPDITLITLTEFAQIAARACCTQRRIVVCASDKPSSAIISTRSRRLSL
jgi:hypothetical protein